MLEQWIEKLNDVVLKHQEVKTSLKELEKQKHDLDVTANRYEQFYIVVDGVLHSWKDKDPGKSSDAYFLLEAIEDSLSRKFYNKEIFHRMVAKELVSEEDITTHKRPTLPLNEALKADCPLCGEKEQYVVEHYVQTEDSPEGDEWLKEKLIPCFKCFNVSLLGEKEYSDLRF